MHHKFTTIRSYTPYQTSIQRRFAISNIYVDLQITDRQRIMQMFYNVTKMQITPACSCMCWAPSLPEVRLGLEDSVDYLLSQ